MEEFQPTQQYGAKNASPWAGEERRRVTQKFEGEERRKGSQVEEIPDDVQPHEQRPTPTD